MIKTFISNVAFKISFLLLILNFLQLNIANSQEIPQETLNSPVNNSVNSSIDNLITQEKETAVISEKEIIEQKPEKEISEKKIEDKEFIWLDNSLMLRQDEIKNLKSALSSLKNNVQYQSEDLLNGSVEKEAQEEDSTNSLVHMSSILFLTNKNWAIWLNNKKITSDNNVATNEFYVEKITATKVSIVWTLGLTKWKILTNNTDEATTPTVNKDNQIINHFTLSPNQTYVLKTNSIVEGRVSNQLPQKIDKQKDKK